jgi:serine/threonine-protein kinase
MDCTSRTLRQAQGSGQAAGPVRFIVMELVESEDLAERLKRGPLDIDDALAVAGQVAAAFTMAHDQGVVHRDLKPGNVVYTSDGWVKVLDFGLAKAFAPDSASWGPISTVPPRNRPGRAIDGSGPSSSVRRPRR